MMDANFNGFNSTNENMVALNGAQKSMWRAYKALAESTRRGERSARGCVGLSLLFIVPPIWRHEALWSCVYTLHYNMKIYQWITRVIRAFLMVISKEIGGALRKISNKDAICLIWGASGEKVSGADNRVDVQLVHASGSGEMGAVSLGIFRGDKIRAKNPREKCEKK